LNHIIFSPSQTGETVPLRWDWYGCRFRLHLHVDAAQYYISINVRNKPTLGVRNCVVHTCGKDICVLPDMVFYSTVGGFHAVPQFCRTVAEPWRKLCPVQLHGQYGQNLGKLQRFILLSWCLWFVCEERYCNLHYMNAFDKYLTLPLPTTPTPIKLDEKR
jgi:hypothetical protein